jgi:hypothetical protein
MLDGAADFGRLTTVDGFSADLPDVAIDSLDAFLVSTAPFSAGSSFI